jgi:asparagine synthase (glutamine-hydrolysing)
VCGINGIFSFSFHGEFSGKVRAMNNCLAHRGPDDEGLFTQPGIALGHRRLSVIDLSSGGHQPMTTPDKRFTLIYNGEIYNYKEVRESLQGPFTSNSDTEVILAAWTKWGPACLDMLNGMFAFALFDRTENKLHIVRDRLGIKPLYYSTDDKKIIFSSELRSLLASGDVQPLIDQSSLQDYLRYQTVHAPQTIVKGVLMLLPGHRMEISSGGLAVKRWWQPQSRASNVKSREHAKNRCRELLTNAVKRRLVADVPFGAFLSGGIDSSAIVALMSQVSDKPVKTFCVTFDESEYNEARFAKQVAERYKTDHHEINITPADFLASLPEALDAMDHPSGDGINTYVVSKATRAAGITMALSGLGGDELFAGYEVFRRAIAVRDKYWMNSIPRFIRKSGAAVIRLSANTVAAHKAAAILSLPKIDFDSFYPLVRQVLSDQQVDALINNKIKSTNRVQEIVRDNTTPADDTHLLSRVSIAEISTYMQNVLLRDADQMSMASALEVRVPFLDYELVEFVLSLPDEFKYPYTPKKLLVDAMRDLLPPEITDRKKMGFVFPWEHWMKNQLKPFCEEHLKWLSNVSALHPSAIEKLWKQFLAGDKKVTWSRIWPLVVLSYWMQKNGVRG